jgi:hypothetical protein
MTITARQFVDKGYSKLINYGYCVIWDDYPYSKIVSITDEPFNDEWPMTMTIDKGEVRIIGIKPDYTMRVDWIGNQVNE